MNKSNMLAKLPLFEGLPQTQLETLAQAAFERRYAAGELIFNAEDPVKGLFVVEDGHVKIFRSTLEGREQTIYMIGPGQPFCLAGALKNDPAPASAPAVAAPAQAVDLQQLGEQLNRLEQKVDRLTALLLKQQQD